MTRRCYIVRGTCLACTACTALATLLAGAGPVFLNSQASPEGRAKDLVSQMTLEEKVGQMVQYLAPSRIPKNAGRAAGADDASTPDSYTGITKETVLAQIRRGEIGSFLNFYGDSIAEGNELQQAALSGPHRIPLLFGADAIHGHAMVEGTTVYPVPIGLAATFDAELVQEIFAATADEMRATGFRWAFAPNVEVARDMRWGRVGETFGEDPLLVSALGVAAVRGLQGTAPDGSLSVLACIKHYLGGSQPTNGQNHGPADFSERTLREVFLPPFAAGVLAGAGSLMVAHNEVNGIPSHANHYLLTEILKDELGFRGLVVSDWLDVSRLWTLQKVAPDMSGASVLSVNAGLDMNMHGPGFFPAIVAGVKNGGVAAERVDDAAERILQAKFALGLFDHNNITSVPTAALDTAAHRELALRAARESIVLLRNEGDLLPLTANSGKIFITGPCADDSSALGDWSNPRNLQQTITVRRGLEKEFSPENFVYFASGKIEEINDSVIARAVEASRGCVVAVLCVGGHPNRGGGPGQITEGENTDRPTLDFVGRQVDLVKAIAATGIPVVVVLQNGGPIANPWLAEHIPAIIEAFYPGERGGEAIVDVLLGKYNPSGRLPYSIPRDVAHSPAYYYQRPGFFSPQGNFGGEKKSESKSPLYPFGFGLSYTQFKYNHVHCSDTVPTGDGLAVEVEVENTGRRAGENILLVYIRHGVTSVTQPVRWLRAWQRVTLSAGEKKTIKIMLLPEAFSILDSHLKRTVEPETIQLQVGDTLTPVRLAGPAKFL